MNFALQKGRKMTEERKAGSKIYERKMTLFLGMRPILLKSGPSKKFVYNQFFAWCRAKNK